MQRLNEGLEHFSKLFTHWAGSSWAFAVACGVVLIWAVSGPFFGYSETWQLVINTGTTIVTFLMIFLVQRTQNKESLAMNLKLNELLATQKGASNALINLEDLSEHEVNALHKRFADLAARLKQHLEDCDEHSVREVASEAEGLLTETGDKVKARAARKKDRAASNGNGAKQKSQEPEPHEA
jgi:low affinity Fe/Cu permease